MEEEFIEHYQKKEQTKPEEDNVYSLYYLGGV